MNEIGARILIVDDEQIVLELMVDVVSIDGHEGVGVNSAEAALPIPWPTSWLFASNRRSAML